MVFFRSQASLKQFVHGLMDYGWGVGGDMRWVEEEAKALSHPLAYHCFHTYSTSLLLFLGNKISTLCDKRDLRKHLFHISKISEKDTEP